MSDVPRHYRGLEAAVAPTNDVPLRTFAYGPSPRQAADLRLPDGEPEGVIVLLHGGAWHAPWDRRQFNGVAARLTRDGFATWNAGYRVIGDGGGYLKTLRDVATAVDLLGPMLAEHGIATDGVTIIGHSAGAQLAMWAAARHRLPPSAPGSAPAVTPRAAVSLAGILDLEGAAGQVIAGRVAAFLDGAPLERPERYRVTSPYELLPLGVRQLVVQGTADTAIPVQQAVAYVDAAIDAGDDVTTLNPAIDHMAYLAPDAPVWDDILSWIRRP